MIREIRAKSLLSRVTGLDRFFGLDYSMNLYRGCQHGCIYCDSRSLCYGIDDFDGDVLVKANAIGLLRTELAGKRRRGIIGTGSMNDPYMPLEENLRLTHRALETIALHQFGVHVVTKATLVLRDLPLLKKIARSAPAAVSLTITTTDDGLARQLEPGAPPPSERLRALGEISRAGVEARIVMMPLLPDIEDTWDNVRDVIERGYQQGVRTIIPSFGVSLRDRQRDHFYRELDRRFPGLRERYERRYGETYMCLSPRAAALEARFKSHCATLGVCVSTLPHLAPTAEEPSLFPLERG